ncbi:hypothetical protein Q3G72_011951 [Acer saccharum]|nr:hypothetical protein Q3G72_011951 [Acer saccharum]
MTFKVGMMSSAANPKPRSCWVAEMNACRGKGEVLPNSRIWPIILAAASADPRIVVNAARDRCSRSLYAMPVLTTEVNKAPPAAVAAPRAMVVVLAILPRAEPIPLLASDSKPVVSARRRMRASPRRVGTGSSFRYALAAFAKNRPSSAARVFPAAGVSRFRPTEASAYIWSTFSALSSFSRRRPSMKATRTRGSIVRRPRRSVLGLLRRAGHDVRHDLLEGVGERGEAVLDVGVVVEGQGVELLELVGRENPLEELDDYTEGRGVAGVNVPQLGEQERGRLAGDLELGLAVRERRQGRHLRGVGLLSRDRLGHGVPSRGVVVGGPGGPSCFLDRAVSRCRKRPDPGNGGSDGDAAGAGRRVERAERGLAVRLLQLELDGDQGLVGALAAVHPDGAGLEDLAEDPGLGEVLGDEQEHPANLGAGLRGLVGVDLRCARAGGGDRPAVEGEGEVADGVLGHREGQRAGAAGRLGQDGVDGLGDLDVLTGELVGEGRALGGVADLRPGRGGQARRAVEHGGLDGPDAGDVQAAGAEGEIGGGAHGGVLSGSGAGPDGRAEVRLSGVLDGADFMPPQDESRVVLVVADVGVGALVVGSRVGLDRRDERGVDRGGVHAGPVPDLDGPALQQSARLRGAVQRRDGPAVEVQREVGHGSDGVGERLGLGGFGALRARALDLVAPAVRLDVFGGDDVARSVRADAEGDVEIFEGDEDVGVTHRGLLE